MAVALVDGSGSGNFLTVGSNKAGLSFLVDVNGNPLGGVNAATIPSAGPAFVPVGAIAERQVYRRHRTDTMGNIRPGYDHIRFRDSIEGTTVNTLIWASTTTTYAIAQTANGGIQLNSAAGVASGSAAQVQSTKFFEKKQGVPLRCVGRIQSTNQSNAVTEFGFGNVASTTVQLPVGFVWRWTGSTILPVFSSNGADILYGTDITGLITATNYYDYEITVEDATAVFTVTDKSTGRVISEQTLNLPAAQGKFWNATHLPLYFRSYTVGAVGTAVKPQLAYADVRQYDAFDNKPWPHQAAELGLGGEGLPTTYAQSSNFANSTVAANATLSNTAAGYATLGGLFSFVAVAGAVTDYALFSIQIPAPYSFFCTGVQITTYNTGAAVATTPSLLHWFLVNNASAVSLATAGLLRRTLGSQYLPIGAAIGQCADKDIVASFQTPYRTDSGRYLTIGLRMPIGTATASQVIQGSVAVEGYFE